MNLHSLVSPVEPGTQWTNALHGACRQAKSAPDEGLGSFRLRSTAIWRRVAAPSPGNAPDRCTAPGREGTDQANEETTMLNSKTLDELAARIGKAFEASPAKDIEKNVKAMLQSGLTKLDLVTRQEFEIQAEVLRKTREKVERLEARVAELEAKTVPPAPPPQPLV